MPGDYQQAVVFFLIDLTGLWDKILIAVAVLVAVSVARSRIAQELLSMVTQSSAQKDEAAEELKAKLAKVKAELEFTTHELRQAREFATEDRLEIQGLRRRCSTYRREINVYRLKAGVEALTLEDDNERES